MIPLKLSIQNFLSYGSIPQVIDFTPYKLICLSGKNGHGKSALLDALTWAIWGQARKVSTTSKPDQGLLRLGQTDMIVVLDFIFNGQQYRIRRMFTTKYGKPTSNVDFGIYDTQQEGYRSLTEKTIRRTQEKIESTIGLDYEAFINSSFLRQGQANEFSKKLPKERKDILANILGLNRYEKAKKYALEKIKLLTQEKEKFSKISEHLTLEVLQLPVVKEKLSVISSTLLQLNDEEQKYVLMQQTMEKRRTELFQKQSAYKLITFEHEQIVKQKNESLQSFQSVVSEWKRTHKQQLALPDRKKLESEKAALLQELSQCQTQYQELLEQKEKLLIYKEQEQLLASEHKKSSEHSMHENKLALEKLSTEFALQKGKHTEIEDAIQKSTLELKNYDRLLETAQKTSDPTLLINDTATLEKQFERQKTFYLTWVERGKQATQELQSLGHKKQLAHTPDNPSCPLCEQNLSLARKRFLAKKLEEQEEFFTHRITRLKKALATLKEHIEKQKQAITVSKYIDELLQKQTVLTQLLAEHNQALERSAQALCSVQKEIEQLKARVAQAEITATATFIDSPHFKDIKNLQKLCETIIQTHAPIPTRLKTLHETHIVLEKQMHQWNSRDEQIGLQQERKKTAHKLACAIRLIETQEKKIFEQVILFKTLPTEEHAFMQEELTLRQSIHTLTSTKELALREQGTLEAELKKLEQQLEQCKQFDTQSKAIQQDLHEYQLLAQAFGKDGIQALLIEDALPEIEQEANDLLSRLTDNQAHIFIESLRDLKKGGVKETLDINISDASGIRPYEMFSGGEAFRIDFSLRIAISKLLARRAGTSLQTLIIDEGFGSQDEEGLARIMDAIYKIQTDFEKIIIVSHLAAMKDQFPIQFLIEKGPNGSRSVVREQG